MENKVNAFNIYQISEGKISFIKEIRHVLWIIGKNKHFGIQG